MSAVRVRFAPSPTGYLHIGGARTALFNWLFARHHGGTLVLRVEDTDKSRNTEEAAAAIYDGLHWLGLNWDEGPHVGGNFGPYFQSQRDSIYEKYLRQLQDAGHIFEDAGAMRFRSPREHVVVDDLIHGKIDFDLSNEETHPDMTVRRPDGSWIFHFVNVVDDIEMKISHVIRGEDHLSNTPKHIELYRALGAPLPRFAHIPLIMNKDGSKMSKRDQGASVDYYIKKGYRPEAVRNYLSLLGWSPKDNREKMSIEETTKIFDLNNVVRSHATFDPAKLHWLNGEYARELGAEEFHDLAVAALKSAGFRLKNFPQITSGPHWKPAKARSTPLMSCRRIAVSTLSMRSAAILKAWRSISPPKTNRVCRRCAMPWRRWKISGRMRSKRHSRQLRKISA